jgi:uncharacterized damage-inducible protein DinB
MGNEINRILKLFADLQHGNCWIGVNYKDALHDVNAEQALAKLTNESNCIWQLVSHIIYWRTSVVNRINGSKDLPPFSDFLVPDEGNENNWKQTLHDLEAAYHALRTAIHHFNEEQLDKPSPRPSQTYYQLIMGCLQHDAYHLGQIMLLKRTIKKNQ